MLAVRVWNLETYSSDRARSVARMHLTNACLKNLTSSDFHPWFVSESVLVSVLGGNGAAVGAVGDVCLSSWCLRKMLEKAVHNHKHPQLIMRNHQEP